MGYMTDGLTFNTLRNANIKRIPTFKNKHGKLAHSKPDGSDWTPSQWLQAVVGELGEYANVRKKFERGDLSLEEFQVEAAKELADVMIYLDILAQRCLDTPTAVHPHGINLGEATISKFNEVSTRVNSDVFIKSDGSDWFEEPKYNCEFCNDVKYIIFYHRGFSNTVPCNMCNSDEN